MIVEVLLLIASLILAILAITGYDKYLALKIKARTALITHSHLYGGSPKNRDIADPYTKSIIRRVKLSRVGSYTIITIVMREGDGEENIDVADVTSLIPFVSDEALSSYELRKSVTTS